MAKLANLARMFTSTAGTTSPLVLGTAVTGFKTFAQAGITDGQVVWYAIKDGSNTELGYGTYTASGTSLTRNVVSSTNSDTAISLSGTGSAEVAITPSAAALLRIESPGGRLTLTTATPVMTSTTSAQTTVYYTPYIHRFVPLYDGTSFEMHDIGAELSQATTDSTKSPAACTTNSNYDLFVWNDSGTYRCTRGPAWTSDTARGTGAGTTELERVQGIYLNKVAITNGPAANRGTYVGTFRTNGSSQVDWTLGGTAAGGTAAMLSIFNAYNQVPLVPKVGDSTDSWTKTAALYGALNASGTGSGLNNRISFIDGLGLMNVVARLDILIQNANNATGQVGICLDNTNALSGGSVHFGTASTIGPINGTYSGIPGLGFHFLQGVETAGGGNAVTFYGDNGGIDPMMFQATLVM